MTGATARHSSSDDSDTAAPASGEFEVRIEVNGPWLGASILTSDGRWIRLHSAHDPIGEADRLVAPAFAHGEPERLVCVGLGLGYVLDAIERRSRRTKVVALEPLPATLPALHGRRGWEDWLAKGRLTILEGPGYHGPDQIWAASEETGAPAREPSVIVHPVLARVCPRLVGEAEWQAERRLSRSRSREKSPNLSEPALGARGSHSQVDAPDPRLATEELLASLARPIAVVGNAQVCYPFGPRIDSYASVVRFNNYRLRGFEGQVGRRTTARCLSGWSDVEHRNDLVEFTPFTAEARESGHLEEYNRENHRPVVSARTDIRPLLTETPNPSTGLALIQLLQALGIPADLFAFDGFRSGHYWTSARLWTTHARTELDCILARGDFVVYGDVFDYRGLYSGAGASPEARRGGSGLADPARRLRGQKVLEIRAGRPGLTRQLVEQGSIVTVLELADVDGAHAAAGAMAGLPGLATLTQPYDWVVAGDVLPHLVANDLTLVLREARRLAPRFLASIPDPGGSRPASWWTALLQGYFDLRPEMAAGHLILLGESALRRPPIGAPPWKS